MPQPKIRPKPYHPAFRGSFPGAEWCSFCYAFSEIERNRMIGSYQVVKNWAWAGENGTGYHQAALLHNVIWDHGDVGPGIILTNGADSTMWAALTDEMLPLDRGTIVWHAKKTTDSFPAAYYWGGNAYPTTSWVAFREANANTHYFYWGGTGTGYYLRIASGDLPTSDREENNLWIFTVGSRGMEIWLNGNLVVVDASATPSRVSSSTARHYIGTCAGGNSPDYRMSYWATYTKQLEYAEIYSIFTDPWGMITPQKVGIIKPYYPTGYGGITTAAVTLNLFAIQADFSVATPSLDSSDTLSLQANTANFSVASPSLQVLDTINLFAVGGPNDAGPELWKILVFSPALNDHQTITLLTPEATFSVSIPTLDISDTLSLQSVTSTFSVPQPSLSSSDTISLLVTSITFSVSNPDLNDFQTLNLLATSATFSVPQPTLSDVQTLNLLAISTTFSIATPSLDSADTLSLLSTEATFSIALPSLSSSDTLSLLATTVTFSVPNPSIDTGAVLDLLPVSATFSVATPSINSSDELSLLAVTATFSIATPSIDSSDTLSLLATTATFSVPNPSIDTGAILDLLPVSAIFNIATPSIDSSDELSLQSIEATFSVSAPAISSLDTLSLTASIATFSVLQPSLTSIHVLNLLAIDVAFSVPNPSLVTDVTVSLLSVEATFSIATPTLDISDQLSLSSVTATFSISLPSLISVTEVTLDLLSVEATFSVPSPSITGLICDDTDFIETIYALIDRLGKNVVFNVRPAGSYDRTTGHVTEAQIGPITRKVTPPRYVDALIEGDLIKDGNAQMYLSACALSFIPEPGLEVVIDDVLWKIVSQRPLYTFTSVGLYDIRLEKLGNISPTASADTTDLDDSLIPTILDIINRLGINATFYVDKYESSNYDRTIGDGAESTPTEVTVKVSPISKFEEYYVRKGLVKYGDMRIYVPASGLTFTPHAELEVLVDLYKWRVVKERPIYTGEQIGVWDLQLRR